MSVAQWIRGAALWPQMMWVRVPPFTPILMMDKSSVGRQIVWKTIKCKSFVSSNLILSAKIYKCINTVSVDLMVKRFPVKEVVAGLTPVCRPNDIRVTVAKLSG